MDLLRYIAYCMHTAMSEKMPKLPNKHDIEAAIDACFFKTFDDDSVDDFKVVLDVRNENLRVFREVLNDSEFFSLVFDEILIKNQVFFDLHERICKIDDIIKGYVLERRHFFRNNPEYLSLSQSARKQQLSGWTHYFDFLYEQLLISVHVFLIQRAKHDVYAFFLEERKPFMDTTNKGAPKAKEALAQLADNCTQMIYQLYRNHPDLQKELASFESI